MRGKTLTNAARSGIMEPYETRGDWGMGRRSCVALRALAITVVICALLFAFLWLGWYLFLRNKPKFMPYAGYMSGARCETAEPAEPLPAAPETEWTPLLL